MAIQLTEICTGSRFITSARVKIKIYLKEDKKVKKYLTPKCTVLNLEYNEDIVTASGFSTKSDSFDTYVSWNDLFGGEAS